VQLLIHLLSFKDYLPNIACGSLIGVLQPEEDVLTMLRPLTGLLILVDLTDGELAMTMHRMLQVTPQ
jgi:hypothetical protein